MGYLDNTSITVDAILTKKGRQLLAEGGMGAFNITQFALSDDEIDYTMFNENHPNGTQYSGEAIENMPITEAIPNENNIMRYKLVTLGTPTSTIPYISLGYASIVMGVSSTQAVQPNTLNYAPGNTEPMGYRFSIQDSRLFDLIEGTGAGAGASTWTSTAASTGVPETITVMGTGINITAKAATGILANYDSLTTTLTVEGMNTSARLTIPLTVSKTL